MHEKRQNPMTMVSMALSALLCSGCVLDGFQKANAISAHVTFEVPAPWELHELEQSAYLQETAKTSGAWFVKMSAAGVRSATSDDAAMIEATMDRAAKGGTQSITERMIAGTRVYALEGDAGGDFGGVYSNLYFIRDGWLVYVLIFDGYENHADAAERVVRTLRVKETYQ